jgi:hypothetical protein
MSTEQEKKMEAAILDFMNSFENFSDKFLIAFATSATEKEEKWYTPRAMFLRLLKVTAVASPPELQIVCVGLHGAISCLGFSGAVNLALKLRRKHKNGNASKKKSAVPGVREGSGNTTG